MFSIPAISTSLLFCLVAQTIGAAIGQLPRIPHPSNLGLNTVDAPQSLTLQPSTPLPRLNAPGAFSPKDQPLRPNFIPKDPTLHHGSRTATSKPRLPLKDDKKLQHMQPPAGEYPPQSSRHSANDNTFLARTRLRSRIKLAVQQGPQAPISAQDFLTKDDVRYQPITAAAEDKTLSRHGNAYEFISTNKPGLQRLRKDPPHIVLLCVAMICFAIIFAWLIDELRRYRRAIKYSRPEKIDV